MKETITIHYCNTIDGDSLAGFRDVLNFDLAAQGSSSEILFKQAPVSALMGQQLKLVWTGKVQFTSPDQAQNFVEERTFILTTAKLDFDFLTKFLGRRTEELAMTYRNSLRGLANMAKSLESGELDPGSLTEIEYIRQTLEASVNAYPNSN